MNEATRLGLIGQPLTFTFGPFLSIYTGMFQPETDGLMIYGGMVLAVTTAGGLLALAGPGRWLPALGFALILPILDMDPQLVAVPLLFLLIAHRLATAGTGEAGAEWRAAILPLMTPALGVLVLVKGTSAIGAFALVSLGAVMLTVAGRGRLAAVCLAGLLAAIVACWLISGQNLTALPAYFANGWYIIAGYPDAMSRAGPYWHIGVFFLACLFICGLHLRHLRGGMAGMLLLLGMAMLLFLGFKEGFVRHGGRHPSAALGIVMLVGWGGLLVDGMRERDRGKAWIGLGAAVACWLAVALTGPLGGDVVRRSYRAWAGLYLRLTQPDYPRAQFEESLAKIRTAVPLPALEGTTDVYSFSQAALLAAGLKWAPRPVLQSYSAYTPELLRADAEHLTGPNAPRNVIFSVQPIDGRLPMLEDGNSWPLLLSLYRTNQVIHLGSYGTDAAILERRAIPGTFKLEPLGTQDLRFGERIALPQDLQSVVWAEVEMRPSLIGRLWGLLYKSPLLFITYPMPDGTESAFRYIYRMGETGFVLSPVVMTATNFVALPKGAPNAPRPTAITLSSEGLADWVWQPQYRIRLYRLTFGAD